MEKISVVVMVLVVLAGVDRPKACYGQNLSENFYENTCKNLENIVSRVVMRKFREQPSVAPGALRIFFHDCIVRGCDASVLVASTPNNKAERDAPDNLSLSADGFDLINKIKHAVEKECPGVVSCADIIAIAARDVVHLVRGPFWNVEKGRRDGRVSRASDIPANLPEANYTVDHMISLFQRKGLSPLDLVALSGAHTIGFSHCNKFVNRIYNIMSSNREGAYPPMNPTYAANLRVACPSNVDSTLAVELDPITPTLFDNSYYKNLEQRMGLLSSDQSLYTHEHTARYVKVFAKRNGLFTSQFALSMINLGRLDVLTGNEGEIRRDCFSIN
eukprot:Gb_39092 [translate_table: standard]